MSVLLTTQANPPGDVYLAFVTCQFAEYNPQECALHSCSGLNVCADRMQTRSFTFSMALRAFSFTKAILVRHGTANEVV